MWPALVKGMLLKKTAKEALDFFVANLPCSGHNYLICDPKEAINVESTGRRVDITYRKEEPGVTFHTNHYVGPLKDVEILDRQSKTTHQRYQALEEFFSKVDERVTENDFLNFLFNPNPQYPIYIPKPKEPHGAMTCGGILYNPALKKGKVFKGAYSEGNIREFSWE